MTLPMSAVRRIIPARLSLDAAELLHEHTARQLALSPGVKALTRRTTTGQRDGFVGPG